MEMTLDGDGPYAGGLHVTFGATAEATIDSTSGEDPSFSDIAIRALPFTTDRVLDDANRLELGKWLVVFAWWMTSFGLNDAGPTLPLPTFLTTDEMVPFGIAAGLELGTITPTVNVTDAHLEVVGEFGERP
jgi:hypothetical protein